MTSTLEREARTAWKAWALYAKATLCTDCRTFTYCGQHRKGGPWLCVTCFDLRPRP